MLPSQLATFHAMNERKPKWLRRLLIGFVVFVVALLAWLPSAIRAKREAQSMSCSSHLVSLGLIARLWADENGERLPTNYECMRYVRELPMNAPRGWVCPADDGNPMAGKKDWSDFNPAHAGYEIVSPGVPDTETNAVLFRCKVHGHLCYADGSVYDGVRRRWTK